MFKKQKKSIIGSIFMMMFILVFAAFIRKENAGIENAPIDLFCTDGGMIVRDFPEMYYTIPNERYFNSSVKGIVGISSEKREYQILNQGGEQLFAIDNSIFISISEVPALVNYDATTYIISSQNNEITYSFKGNVVYISNQNKLVFYIRNNFDNQEKGGLYCCDISGKNEKKIMNGNLDYLGRDGEHLYFQGISRNKLEIFMYNQEEDMVKKVSDERYNKGMEITDFKVTDGIVNYIYGHYEGQLGDFSGKIVTVFLQGKKKESKYEIMKPQFFVSDSKIYYCIYRNEREIKYCVSLELNQKKQIEFDNILLNKENKNEYVTYKNVDCFGKLNVSTKSGKIIAVCEDKLREALEISNNKTLVKIRRMDVYEDYIYMNIELWESQIDNTEIFLDRELLELDIENNEYRKMIKH